ncbi:carbamoyl transferase [Acidobacteria bacterium AH-259-D05]|nr:carbamoyl transferase [Acidobacteria bacterium AH-259-D05]
MIVLGVGPGLKLGHHDGSAALVVDGRIIAAAEEERFLRAKHARGELPLRAAKYCLRQAGISIQDVDVVASPLRTYDFYDRRLQDYFEFHFGHSPPIRLLDHHQCHIASTYLVSNFTEALILSLDFSGDSCSGLVAAGRRRKIRELRRFSRENSLGVFYGMLTQFLGFQMTEDEFKVMGLASYGTPRREYDEAFDQILRIDNQGGYTLDPKFDKRFVDAEIYTSDFVTRQEQMFSGAWIDLLGPPGREDEPVDQRHADIAASGQQCLEKVVRHIVRYWYRETDLRKLCLAGGCALNVKMNAALRALDCIDEIFVQPAASDAGVPLGAALAVCHEAAGRIKPVCHAALGPEYTDWEIEKTLKMLRVPYCRVEDVAETVAAEIAVGNIVGWFQGRMEFGPRALGHRSILADPRDASMKDRINEVVKFREDFRPFCPSVTLEDASRFFVDSCESPFMTMVFEVRGDKKACLPAVTHVDGTARVQTVGRDLDPLFWRLLKAFEARSGIPVLLNTSMNVRGEPIALAPEHAVRVFYGSGMDILAIGNFVLRKQGRISCM